MICRPTNYLWYVFRDFRKPPKSFHDGFFLLEKDQTTISLLVWFSNCFNLQVEKCNCVSWEIKRNKIVFTIFRSSLELYRIPFCSMIHIQLWTKLYTMYRYFLILMSCVIYQLFFNVSRNNKCLSFRNKLYYTPKTIIQLPFKLTRNC